MAEEERSAWGIWRGRLHRVFGRGSSRVAHESRNALELDDSELMQPSTVETGVSFHSSRSLESIVDLPVECAPDQGGEGEQQASPRFAATSSANEPNLHSEHYGSRPHLIRDRSTCSTSAGFDARTNPRFLNNVFDIWDNRLALKLFGNRRGILKEEERLKNCPHWVIHPCSKFRCGITV